MVDEVGGTGGTGGPVDDTVGDAPVCVGDAVDDVGEAVQGIVVRALLTELVTPIR